MRRDTIDKLGSLDATDIGVSRAAIRRHWRPLIWLGLLLIAGGVVTFVTPIFASVMVESVIGWVLLIAGITQVFHAWQAEAWRPRLFHAASGIIYTLTSLPIILNPLAGLVTVALVVIVALFADGVVRVALGASMRPEPGWFWVLVSGLGSVIAAVILLAMWPVDSFFFLGFLTAASLILEGWSFLFVAHHAQREARSHRDPLDEVAP